MASEIAFMKNTSDGLNTIAAGLGLRPGDNVVVCPEFEHANNIYPWQNRQQDGLEVRFVPMSGGSSRRTRSARRSMRAPGW